MSNRFELPAGLNIYSALETRDALLAWSSTQSGNTPLEVSASAVNEIDGAGLQLLASLSNMERPWRLVETSECFTEACKTIGFAHWLDQGLLKSAT